jgi:hypothetical protein
MAESHKPFHNPFNRSNVHNYDACTFLKLDFIFRTVEANISEEIFDMPAVLESGTSLGLGPVDEF